MGQQVTPHFQSGDFLTVHIKVVKFMKCLSRVRGMVLCMRHHIFSRGDLKQRISIVINFRKNNRESEVWSVSNSTSFESGRFCDSNKLSIASWC